jgi:phospholipid/cholesterol/gamma-HCH transport system substrate-binding protein
MRQSIRAATRGRLRAAAGLIATAIVATGCGPGLQDFPVGRSVSGPTYHLTAVFDDASGLPIGGRVELRDVEIGKVTSMTTHGFEAYVHLVIRKSVLLPVGTRATLALTTPLGEEYVDLLAPARGEATRYLAGGEVIEATNRSPDVESLLSAFSAVLNGGGIGQISTIVRELDAALHGRAASGKALIARLNDVLGQLNAHSASIDHTLQAVADLSSRLGAQHRLIVRGLRELAPGIHDLHADTAAFTKLLTRLSTLGETATQVLDSVQGTLLTDLDDLAPTLDTLVSLRGKLGSTLQGLLDFARLLNRAIPGDYLNLVGKVKVP